MEKEEKATKIMAILHEFEQMVPETKALKKSAVMIKLRKACETKYGLVTDEIRQKVWPMLLQLSLDPIKPHWNDTRVFYKDKR